MLIHKLLSSGVCQFIRCLRSICVAAAHSAAGGIMSLTGDAAFIILHHSKRDQILSVQVKC